jgi:hypothetical protein
VILPPLWGWNEAHAFGPRVYTLGYFLPPRPGRGLEEVKEAEEVKESPRREPGGWDEACRAFRLRSDRSFLPPTVGVSHEPGGGRSS